MTDTAWSFEYETLVLREERRVEEVGTLFKAVRKELMNLLGLNLMPMEDEDGKLRRPTEYEYIPLAVMTAREGFVEAFLQRNEELSQMEEVEKDLEKEEQTGKSDVLTPEELDDFMHEDITFLDDPEELQRQAVLASPGTKWINKNIVKPLETEAKVAKEKDETPMKVSIQSEPVAERPISKSKRRVTVSSE